MLLAILAMSEAVSKDIGLLATFLGIGLIVNVIVVFIAVLVRGEHQQNRDADRSPVSISWKTAPHVARSRPVHVPAAAPCMHGAEHR